MHKTWVQFHKRLFSSLFINLIKNMIFKSIYVVTDLWCMLMEGFGFGSSCSKNWFDNQNKWLLTGCYWCNGSFCWLIRKCRLIFCAWRRFPFWCFLIFFVCFSVYKLHRSKWYQGFLPVSLEWSLGVTLASLYKQALTKGLREKWREEAGRIRCFKVAISWQGRVTMESTC